MLIKATGGNIKPYKQLHFTGKAIESLLNWEGEGKASKGWDHSWESVTGNWPGLSGIIS